MTPAAEPRLIRIPGPHAGPDWRTSALEAAPASRLSALDGDGTGLRLVADPGGPLRLDSRDGSIGRLALPANVAIDGRLRVYLLDPEAGVVRRYDPADPWPDADDPGQLFRPLPLVGNNQGGDPRGRWDGPRNPRRVGLATGLAVDAHALYLADAGGRRVLVFALDTWALREVWRFQEPECPWGLVAHHGVVDVLTAEAIHRYQPGDERPRRFIERGAAQPWHRLAADCLGRLYALAGPAGPAEPPELLVFDPTRPGRPRERVDAVRDAAAVRDRFPLPAVFTVADEEGTNPLWYVIPEPLTRPAGREWPKAAAHRPAEAALAAVPEGAVVVDARGRRVNPATDGPPPRSRLFDTGKRPGPPDSQPAWISKRLDSKVFRCVWDAVEVGFADLPPGTAAEFSTYTSDSEDEGAWAVRALPEEAWAPGLSAPGLPRGPEADPRQATDFLVGSPPGRYLWVRVRFRGDGFATPVLELLTVRFPRRSYLEHLPAVFSEDDASRRFLERFLAVFQFEWDRLEDEAATVARLFDPGAAPPRELDRLAGWLGVAFPPGASEADKRRLLAGVPDALFAPPKPDPGDPTRVLPGGPRRGTPASLRKYLAAVLPGVAWPAELGAPVFPLVIDGFRERDHRTLFGSPETDPAGGLPAADDDPDVGRAGRPLWGPDEVGRFQLGVSSRLDEGRLVPAGKPELDAFAARAHRFRVVLPAAWVDTPDKVAAVRRAIEEEAPAHTAFTLDLVRPGVRVGVQSTVGVDTILGGPPPGLGPDGPRLGADQLPPAARAAEARLDAGLRLGTDPARI